MAKPILLTVDDDEAVLRAVERDLRKRYAERYRIVRASSGAEALDAARRLQLRNEAVALYLADHRMPGMSGVEFLDAARAVYPDAKRVLLTAYADTQAAIQAINQVQLHHYLLKPWDPPEERLYPVLDELLEDWFGSYRPPFDGLRVLGARWSPRAFELREFLAKNQVPYRWLDLELRARDPEVERTLTALNGREVRYPAVVLPNGELLEQPSNSEVASKGGFESKPSAQSYDLAIVGAGPAGLAAAVYGASEGLKTVLIEKEAPGGQAGLSSRIENYLGFPMGLSGADLARNAMAQARRLGAEFITPREATALRTEGPFRSIEFAGGGSIATKAVVIATGLSWRRLSIPGLDPLIGAGVYYGAGTSEARACGNEDVYIIGGANSAGQAAMNFSKYARRVVMLVRGTALSATMSHYLIEQIAANSKIEVRLGTEVIAARGQERLEELTLRTRDGVTETVPATSLFIFIGAEPRTDWIENTVTRDPHGFVLTGEDLVRAGKRPAGWQLDRDPAMFETNVPGVYAVGDVRHGAVRRVASSVGEGSVVVFFAWQYLSKL